MLKLFKSFDKKDLLFIFICIVLVVFQVYLDLKLPDYMSDITRLIQTEGSKINDIVIKGLGFIKVTHSDVLDIYTLEGVEIYTRESLI